MFCCVPMVVLLPSLPPKQDKPGSGPHHNMEGPSAPLSTSSSSPSPRRRRHLLASAPRLLPLLLFLLPSTGAAAATTATGSASSSSSSPPSRAWGAAAKRSSSSSSTTTTTDKAGFSGEDSRIYDYVKACNPDMPVIPPLSHRPELHQTGPTRVIPFDLGKQMGVSYTATSPNLLASFVRVKAGEKITTSATATSQAFYVIRGSGVTRSKEHGDVRYSQGDLFVLPHTKDAIEHEADADSEDVALYWVTDEPLLRYLGVEPNEQKFKPTVFRRTDMIKYVEELRHDESSQHKNRLGILLGNKVTEDNTKTLTHTLWSLLNLLPAKTAQPPHRHNSVALDLCVSAASEGVYTLMGPELDENGWVKDPIRLDWKSGGTFVTPPGWWHSHHNEGDQDAWVLPLQDAGLYTHMRSLDIRFSKATKESENKDHRRIE